MNEKEALEYLQKKGKISKSKTLDSLTEREKKMVKQVTKEGKIYGDPIAEIQW